MQCQHQMVIKKLLSLQIQSQHQMVIYKVIVIANAEHTSNGHTKLLSLQMQSQHQIAIQNHECDNQSNQDRK